MSKTIRSSCCNAIVIGAGFVKARLVCSKCQREVNEFGTWKKQPYKFAK